jgi:hypothetical protein
MELPAEIVGVIREYSKPVFKYFREYNAILKLLGLGSWKHLKDALRGTDADDLIVLVRIYMEALMETRRLQRRYAATRTQENKEALYSQMDNVRSAYKALELP